MSEQHVVPAEWISTPEVKAHPCPDCMRRNDFLVATVVDIQGQLLDIATMLRRVMPLVDLAEKMTAEKSILGRLRR